MHGSAKAFLPMHFHVPYRSSQAINGTQVMRTRSKAKRDSADATPGPTAPTPMLIDIIPPAMHAAHATHDTHPVMQMPEPSTNLSFPEAPAHPHLGNPSLLPPTPPTAPPALPALGDTGDNGNISSSFTSLSPPNATNLGGQNYTESPTRPLPWSALNPLAWPPLPRTNRLPPGNLQLPMEGTITPDTTPPPSPGPAIETVDELIARLPSTLLPSPRVAQAEPTYDAQPPGSPASDTLASPTVLLPAAGNSTTATTPDAVQDDTISPSPLIFFTPMSRGATRSPSLGPALQLPEPMPAPPQLVGAAPQGPPPAIEDIRQPLFPQPCRTMTLPALSLMAAMGWAAPDDDQMTSFAPVPTRNSSNLLATFRYEPSIVMYKKWAASLRNVLVLLAGTSRNLRGDNVQQAALFARSGEPHQIKRIFLYIDQIASACPSAIKTLLDITDCHFQYPLQSAAAARHHATLFAYKQAEKQDGQRVSNIIMTQSIMQAALAAGQAAPTPAPRPAPTPEYIATLTADCRSLSAAAAASPTDTHLAAQAARSASTLADALNTTPPGQNQAGPSGSGTLNPTPHPLAAAITDPTNPQGAPIISANTTAQEFHSILKSLATPATAALPPLKMEQELFETLIEILEPALNTPSASEYNIYRQLAMGRPDALHPEVGSSEMPRAFADRLLTTCRLLRLDGNSNHQVGFSVNLREAYIKGLPTDLHETAIRESHRAHPTLISPEEAIHAISIVVESEYMHIMMDRMSRDASRTDMRSLNSRMRTLDVQPHRRQPNQAAAPLPPRSRPPMAQQSHTVGGHYDQPIPKWCNFHHTSSHNTNECLAISPIRGPQTNQPPPPYRQPLTRRDTNTPQAPFGYTINQPAQPGTRRVAFDDTPPLRSALRSGTYPPPPNIYARSSPPRGQQLPGRGSNPPDYRQTPATNYRNAPPPPPSTQGGYKRSRDTLATVLVTNATTAAPPPSSSAIPPRSLSCAPGRSCTCSTASVSAQWSGGTSGRSVSSRWKARTYTRC